MTEKLDRLFRIDVYPQDWITDFCDLEPEVAGVATQIIMLMYAKRGPIDNDASDLCRKLKNLSSRKCRAIVDKLVENDFFQITQGGKLTKRRVEKELNTKRTHLEHAANGGRTRAENERARKKIKDLASSDTSESLAAPSPSPSPSPKESRKVGKLNPVDKSETGKGRDFNKLSDSGDRARLSEKALASAQRNAPGWDIRRLTDRWWEWASRQSDPIQNPDASFIAWTKRNIQGKPPP